MATPDIWYMKDLALVERLPAESIQQFRKEGRMERWGHRAEISRHGDPEKIFLVLKGGVRLGADHLGTSPIRLKAGDIYGELRGAVENRGDSFRLNAYDDTTVVALERPYFEEAAGSALGELQTAAGPIFGRKSLEVPVSSLLFTPARRRLAKVILHLTEKYGALEADNGMLALNLKARHLAQLAGLGTAHASEILDELQRDKIVEVGGRQLIIPSVARIHEITLRT